MSVQTYPVSSPTPVGIYPAGQQGALTVSNDSVTATAYLSDLPNNNGYALRPGAAITWDAGKALYAYVAVGSPATLTVIDNGGALFSPKAIADQLSAGGLATEIANAITLNGIPTIDVPTRIAAGSVYTTGTAQLGAGTLNVSRYTTLILNTTESFTGSPNVPRRFEIIFYHSGAASERRVIWLAAGTQTYRFPVEGDAVAIIAWGNSVTTEGIGWTLEASYKVTPTPEYVHTYGDGLWTGQGEAADGYAALGYTGTAAAFATRYPPSRAGQCLLAVQVAAVTVNPVTFTVADLATGYPLGVLTFPVLATGQAQSLALALPSRPVILTLTGGTVTTLTASLVYH